MFTHLQALVCLHDFLRSNPLSAVSQQEDWFGRAERED